MGLRQLCKRGAVLVLLGLIRLPAVIGQDTTPPPSVLNANFNDVMDRVIVQFSQGMDSTSLTDLANYRLDGGLHAEGIEASPDRKAVALVLDPSIRPQLDTSYTVTVQNVLDALGIAIGTNNTATTPSIVLSPGFLSFWIYDTPTPSVGPEIWNVEVLTSNDRYPAFPRSRFFLSTFESRLAYPDDKDRLYGGRFTGFFIPPETGNWIFYTSQTLTAQLWLNRNGDDPAGLERIIDSQRQCSGFGGCSASEPILLQAGRPYMIMALYKVGLGGRLEVAAQTDSDPTDPMRLPPIPAKWLACYAPAGTLAIATQPQPQTCSGTTVVGAEDFSLGPGLFTVTTTGMPRRPWTYSPASKSWAASDGQDNWSLPFRHSDLSSPTYRVSTPGMLTMTFTHRYNFEQNTGTGVNFDAGQLWTSVNGAPYASVPGGQFMTNGYNGSLTSEPHNLFMEQEAFVARSTNYITSQVNLGNFKTGDTVSVQFVAAWDELREGSEPNWQIKSMEFNPPVERAVTLAAFKVQYTANLPGWAAPPVILQWQIDRGAGFVDLPCATKPDLEFIPKLTDDGAKVRCLLRMPGLKETLLSDSAVLTVQETALTLQAVRSASGVEISWPADPDCVLEQTAGFVFPSSSTKWTAVAKTPTTTGGTNRLTLSAEDARGFYRLRH